MKIPLAWLQLTNEKVRLLIALAGIGFADLLMFMQLGFRDALYDSSIRLHQQLKGDIFLMSPQTNSIVASQAFSKRRLYQALSVEGVEKVSPLYIAVALFKNPVEKNSRAIYVIGINPNDHVVMMPGVEKNIDQIKQEDVILFDQKSRKEFGPIREELEAGKKVTVEVKGKRVTVKGLFSLGTSFGADGNLLTSDTNFFRLLPSRNKGLIDIGILEVKPGANVDNIVKVLQEFLPKDVTIFSRKDFLEHERSYWKKRTAVGFIFTLGTIMGFVVGIVIVYQILYTDVTDHLPEYATLKAMGYTDYYLLTVILQEAVILAVLGYFPGFLVSNVLYQFTFKATGLPITMLVNRAVTVLVLTVIMCIVSGSIAVSKLRLADPADIY